MRLSNHQWRLGVNGFKLGRRKHYLTQSANYMPPVPSWWNHTESYSSHIIASHLPSSILLSLLHCDCLTVPAAQSKPANYIHTEYNQQCERLSGLTYQAFTIIMYSGITIELLCRLSAGNIFLHVFYFSFPTLPSPPSYLSP